jgi:hypothetical protein
LVADEILQLPAPARRRRDPVVCPSVERLRAPLEAAFGALGVPYALDGTLRAAHTSFGRALLAIVRYAWLGGGRRDLFAFLRSPYSGLARAHADFLEGRLRGRGIRSPARLEATIVELRGQPLAPLERLRSAPTSIAAVRDLAASMLRAAYGLDAPPASPEAWIDLRTYQTIVTLLDELEAWWSWARLSTEELAASLERARSGSARALGARDGARPVARAHAPRGGRVRPRWRRASSRSAPRLAVPGRRRRRELGDGARLAKPDPVSRAYLFYTARHTAVATALPRPRGGHRRRRAAPAEPVLGGRPGRAAAGRPAARDPQTALSELVWPLEGAPSERERLRAVSWLSTTDRSGAEGIALANGWERRLARVRRLPPADQVHGPGGARVACVAHHVRRHRVGGVCGLLVDLVVERMLDPKSMDAEVDPRMRGSIAHQTLFKFSRPAEAAGLRAGLAGAARRWACIPGVSA